MIVVTKDQRTYEFDVTSLSAATINGPLQSIPVDQVVSIQKRDLNVKKTGLLVVLVIVGVALTVALVQAIQGAGAAGILNSTH